MSEPVEPAAPDPAATIDAEARGEPGAAAPQAAGQENIVVASASPPAVPKNVMLKNLSVRHGLPLGRERTATQSSNISLSLGRQPNLSPRLGPAPAPLAPFALEPGPSGSNGLASSSSSGGNGAIPEAGLDSEGAVPSRKPRTRTRVSGHPTAVLAHDASAPLQRGVTGLDRDSSKLGTLAHRTSVAAPTRFVPLNQALVTTDSVGRILTANETLCRILGYSQSEVTGGDVLSFLSPAYRDKQKRFFLGPEEDDGVSEAVLVSGTVVQIQKKDTRTSPASLWLKEKRTMSGSRVLMWVFEPILENNVNVTITKDGKIVDASGACEDLFGYSEEEIKLRRFWDLVPSLKPYNTLHAHFSTVSPANSSPGTPSPSSSGPFDVGQIDRHKFFGAVTRQGITVPIIAKTTDDSLEEVDEEDRFSDEEEPIELEQEAPQAASPPRSPQMISAQTYKVHIISMPNIAGVITLHADGTIQSCNTVFAKYLFGLASKDLVNKINITTLIPQFWTLVLQIGNENLRGQNVAASFSPLNNSPTPAVPEGGSGAAAISALSSSPSRSSPLLGHEISSTATGEAIVRTSGVIAYHRDGTPFNIDLQIRAGLPGSDVPYMLSITYDRYAANKAAILAQHVQGKVTGSSPVGSLNGREIAVAEDALQVPSVASVATAGPSHSDSAVRLRRMSVSIDRTMKTIHDYNILDTLGEGAYGFVKLAERKEDPNKEKVVIKFVIKSRILVDTWIRDRDLGVVPMEIHVLNYLRRNPHPCVVRIMDYWEDAEFFYIEMHLHGWGMDLFDYIEITDNMTEADIKYIFHQIALAVQHLHKHGIVHRDIKDENVILDENLSIQLIDFGSSAYFREGKKFDTFCGTLDYASPEVLTGHKYDGPPQDIWALGILLYTMIYKENPFYNIDEIISHPLRVPFVMSPESLDLIRNMLNRDVRSRPTIDDVLNHVWFRYNASPGIDTPQDNVL